MTCYVEVPVFADGGWSDVEQIEVPCDEPPDPEEDYFDPIFLPELPSRQVAAKIVGKERVKFLPDPDDDGWWPDHEVAIIDYDPPFNAARYEGF